MLIFCCLPVSASGCKPPLRPPAPFSRSAESCRSRSRCRFGFPPPLRKINAKSLAATSSSTFTRLIEEGFHEGHDVFDAVVGLAFHRPVLRIGFRLVPVRACGCRNPVGGHTETLAAETESPSIRAALEIMALSFRALQSWCAPARAPCPVSLSEIRPCRPFLPSPRRNHRKTNARNPCPAPPA
jgi:hypothetical protein